MWRKDYCTSSNKKVAVNEAIELMKEQSPNVLSQRITSVTYDVSNKLYTAEISFLSM